MQEKTLPAIKKVEILHREKTGSEKVRQVIKTRENHSDETMEFFAPPTCLGGQKLLFSIGLVNSKTNFTALFRI